MYLQITTYCNMSCAHCCFSCEKGKKGEHMSMSVARAAIKFNEDTCDYLTIGGGEPTIHPKFWEIFGLAIGGASEGVWMATNGSITDRALALAALSYDGGKFQCALSQDYYHEPIDYKVISAFRNANCELRDVSKHIINVGAAKENDLGGSEGCACEDLQIKPNGNVHQCGCEDSPVLFNVLDKTYPDLNYYGECYKNNED